MTTDATAAPSRTAARRYSEQLHTLVDPQTRAYTLGMAMLAAKSGGYTLPREADEVRDLLDEAIGRRFKADPEAYRRAVAEGHKLMAERREQAEARANRINGMATTGAAASE
jgi:hypothetical protein